MTKSTPPRLAGWAVMLIHLVFGLTVETYRMVVAWPVAFICLKAIDCVIGGSPSVTPEIMAAEYLEAVRLDNLAIAVVVAEFLVGACIVTVATRPLKTG